MSRGAAPAFALLLLTLAGCTIRESQDPAAVAVAEQVLREMRATR